MGQFECVGFGSIFGHKTRYERFKHEYFFTRFFRSVPIRLKPNPIEPKLEFFYKKLLKYK